MPHKSIFTTLSIIAFSLSLILLLRTVVLMPYSSDSYLHLSIGKYIAIFQSIPSHFDISFKTADISLEWISHSWLSDSILYAVVHDNLQIYGSVVAILMWGVCLRLLCLIMSEYSIDLVPKLLIYTLLQFVAQIYWRIHPILFVTPLLLMTIWVLIRAIHHDRRILFSLPALSLAWANMYGGYIFIFFLICLAYFILYVVSNIQKKSSLLLVMLLALGSSFAMSLLNPYGIRIYLSAFAFIGTVQLKQAFVMLPNYLSLINQSFILENVSTIPHMLFAVLLIGCISFTILLLIRGDRHFFKLSYTAIPTLLLFGLAYIYIRLIPLVLFATATYAALILNYALSKRKKLSYFVIALLSLAIPYFTYQLFFPYKILVIEPPVKQIELIQKYHLPGNIMTTSDYTGYAKYILPNKMNIDLLDEIYDESETLNVLLQGGTFTKETLSKTLDGKHIGTLLVHKETGNFARSVQISLHEDWALIYLDQNGALFVRRDKVSSSFLKEHELKYLSFTSSLGAEKVHIHEATVELENAIKRYPDNVLYKGQLASLYRVQKQANKGINLLLTVPVQLWNYRLYTEMGRLHASIGNCQEAEQSFLSALDDRTETNYSQAVLDLAITYAGCLNNSEKAKHYFERYLSFTLPQYEKAKARKLASDFGIYIE